MQRLTELLGCKGLDVLLGITIAVADDILTDKDNEEITPTDLGRTRTALLNTASALTDIESRLYRTLKWTQEQKRERLLALLDTATKTITKDSMTTRELTEAYLALQEAIEDIKEKYHVDPGVARVASRRLRK